MHPSQWPSSTRSLQLLFIFQAATLLFPLGSRDLKFKQKQFKTEGSIALEI